MKTIREWLEDLPEPYRGQALANMDIQRPGDHGGPHPCMRNAIEASFRWIDSTEGTAYWSDLRDKYKRAPANSSYTVEFPADSPTNALSALHAIALKEGFPVEEIASVQPAKEPHCWIYTLVNDSPGEYFINLKTDK